MSSKPNIQVCLVSDLFNNHIISNDTTVVVVDLLRAICKQTTNTLDDRAVDILEKQLFPSK